MIHTIEALIVQRKELQKQLVQLLADLADAASLPFWKRRKRVQTLSTALRQVGTCLTELITVSNQEWDAQHNNHSGGVFNSLQWKMDQMEAEYRHARTVMSNFADLETRLNLLIESLPGHREPADLKEELHSIREQLSPFQYADFEQRFRGGLEAVRKQLQKYVPLFKGHDPVLDLGCGRGEFVAMLQEADIQAGGVDLSPSMLREATNLNLPCRHGDILSTLKASERASLGGIFSAQVIEHFDADLLRQVVTESFQVLKPGGLILLETVNPLSLFAFSRIYLLDTTHRSALHPEFMRYLLESSGYRQVEILYGPLPEGERLALLPPEAPQSSIHNENIDRLNRLLFGPSIYAIKGIKP